MRRFYTWKDQFYREFMLKFLQCLEPRFESRGTILLDELEECNEIIFVYKGSVVVGYEINKVKKYCIRYQDRCVIGAYGVAFNNRSCCIYTALTNVHGYFIRKEKWADLCDENEEIAQILSNNIICEYITQIRSKVVSQKKQTILEMLNRKDHQMIFASEYKDAGHFIQ